MLSLLWKGGIIQSTKILLLPPKFEIIMLPSNYSFFQYCDSNIGFSLLLLVKLSLLILFASFLVSLLCFFFDGSLSLKLSLLNYRDSDSCRSFSLLKAIAKTAKTIAVAIIGRAITKWGAIEKSPILLSKYWKNDHN